MDQHFRSEDYYNAKVIDEIIHNDKSHIVAEFKDYLIKGDISEFLQQYYNKKDSLFLLPKIYEYYINCSVIFPNYVILPESKYIYNSIQKKQRVIDIQQEQEDKEQNLKKGLIEQEKQPTVFNSQAFDSILNQTDTSGVKQYFGISLNGSKSGEEPEVMKIINDIDSTEKNIDIYNKNKKNKINVCQLKKGKNINIIHCLNNVTLNQDGYIQKFKNIFYNKKKNKTFFERKNNILKNNLKYNFRKITDNNNNHKMRVNYSSQITGIDSFNNQMKKIFDLKRKESKNRAKKNTHEKENEKISSKNNSQIFSSIKSKEKSNKYNNKCKDNFSENYSINRNIIKNIKKGTKNKEIINRNNIILNFHKNIKNSLHNPFRNLTQSINTINSYKTKSKKKSKSKGKGNQTTRNKYDNISIYINSNKNNISNNYQSIDCNKNYNKINNTFKKKIINSFLLNDTNKKKQKAKYKNMLIQRDNKESFINSIIIKDINIKDNNINNEKIINENYDKDNDINNNNLIINNNQKSLKSNDNINYFWPYKNNEKSNSLNNKKIRPSNSYNNNNNKFSSTKKLYINSYRDKPKYSISNINAIIHKKLNSVSKIPISFPENKILINNKINYNKNSRENSNKNKIKEKLNNYFDDNHSSKEINNCNSIQIKNNQDNNNNSKNINKNEVIPSNNLKVKKKEKNKSNKIRNSIFNFEKNLSKKKSEKNVNIFEIFKPKNSSKNLSNKSGNIKKNEYGPLSARETNKYQNNSEMIELLTSKIQTMKKSIKETSDKDSYSISSIFKKKRMPTGCEYKIKKIKKSEEFTEKKTRNKNNDSNYIETTNSNAGINGNVINNIINNILQINLLNTNKNNLECDKLMKTFEKFKKPTNSFIGINNNNASNYNNSINNNIGSKKESKRKIKHEKCKSILNNNYGNNFNIEINNLDIHNKKIVNNLNNKFQNNNIKNVNINFNNYTNNYNYKINPINNNINNFNKINNGNMNFNNSNLNKGKSNSLKMITNGKPLNKKENHLKGIPINGFETIVNKKNNTRNYNIPMSFTDRVKQNNTYSTSSIINNKTNSNKYKKINNINKRVYK